MASALMSGAAWAQSTVGGIYGSADGKSAVKVENSGTGLIRSVTPDAEGRFNVGSLPPGHYRVTAGREAREVDVVAGQSTAVNLAGQGDAQELGAVVVRGAGAPFDVTSVESSTTFTAREVRNLPVAENITAVALLAPGTVRGDSDFGNLASFNGASVAENSYYVNGFNVTNQFTNLVFGQVPFQAVSQFEVKTGGYGAEYGYSTGGVISVVTQRGTNEWKGGVSFDWSPNSLRESQPDILFRRGESAGRIYALNGSDSSTDTVASAWLGGPIVKDTLFVYAMVSQERNPTRTYQDNLPFDQPVAGGYRGVNRRNPYWLAKVDWHINDSNLLEYTGFSDLRHTRTDYYTAAYGSAALAPYHDAYQGSEWLKQGGRTDILNYTANLTDDLTLTAQYGREKNARNDIARSASGVEEFYDGVVGNFDQPGCAAISDRRTPALNNLVPRISGCNFVGSLSSRGGGDEKKAGRVDLEWRIGAHDLKAGYSRTNWSTTTGSSYEGGALYRYYTRPGSTDASGSPASSFVREIWFQTGATVRIEQPAFYLQDNWQVTDRFLAYAGLRNDSFDNRNGLGQSYVKQDDIWQPRIGFSWDAAGDQTLKVFGTAGLYSLPVAANVALRAASASIFGEQDFFYTGVDPVTGRPLGTSTGTGLPFEQRYYINGETGRTPDPRSVADRNLKPYQQQEIILGAQKQTEQGWTFGAKGIWRRLKNAIDDTCDWRPLRDYGINVLGLQVDDYPPPTSPGCFIYNPGRGMTVDVDLDGDGTLEHVPLSAAQLGEPKAKRKYLALELSAGRSWQDRFFLNASYTWSHSYGNTEGLVKSDIGQSDTGTTEDFDYPEFAVGSNGSLPNDRRHTFKFDGAFQASPEWLFSANATLQSGRPVNCFGYDAAADDYIGYGAAYFYCNGRVVPRGSVGRLQWFTQLDLGITYTPQWLKGLALRTKVFNLFNRRTPLSVDEQGEDNVGNPSSSYLLPASFQTPRYLMFSVQYDFTL